MRILAVYLILLVHVMDTSIANVALYSVATDLGVDIYHGQWIVTSFGIGMIAAIPYVPKLVEWLGSSVALSVILGISIASLALCGLATSFSVLVIARLIQGLSSSAVVLLLQKLLLNYVGPERRALGLALWTSAMAISPVIGPMVGAASISVAGWRFLFLAQIPVLLICSLAIRDEFKFSWQTQGRRPHAAPAVLLLLAALFLQLALEEGLDIERRDPQKVAAYSALFIAVVVSLAAFTRKLGIRLFDWTLLANSGYRLYMLVSASLGSLVTTTSIIYTLWMQIQLHLPIGTVAEVLASGGLITGFLSPLIGRSSRRSLFPLLLLFGLACMTASFWLCTRITADSTLFALMLPRIVAGFGMGFCSPSGFLSVSELESKRILDANSLGLFVRVVTANVCLVAGATSMKRLDVLYSELQLAGGYASDFAYKATRENPVSFLNTWLHGVAFTGALHTIYWVSIAAILTLIASLIYRIRPLLGSVLLGRPVET